MTQQSVVHIYSNLDEAETAVRQLHEKVLQA